MPQRISLDLAAEQRHSRADDDVDVRFRIQRLDQLVERLEWSCEVGIEVAAVGRAVAQRLQHADAHRLRLASIRLLIDDRTRAWK